MTTTDIIAFGSVIVGISSVIVGWVYNIRKEFKDEIILIWAEINKLKDQHLQEILEENKLLKEKNEKLKEVVKVLR